MTAPNIEKLIADHADDEVREALHELQEAAERVALCAQRLAKMQAHAAVARAMNGGTSE